MLKKHILFFLASGIITISGCTDNRTTAKRLSRHNPENIQTVRPELVNLPVATEVKEAKEPNGPATLEQLRQMALLHNPELAAFGWQIRQAEADRLQASLPPNPQLEYELEEFGGRGEIKEFEAAVNKFHLIQLIELGGKRTKRTKAASLELELVEWDYLSKRMDILREVADNYVAVLAAQQRVSLASELRDISQQVLKTVISRVEAGKDSPVEQLKARVALANFHIEMKQAQYDLKSARKRLAATCGAARIVSHGLAEQLETLDGRLEGAGQIPSLEQLQTLLEQNPNMARRITQIEKNRQGLELEKAKTIVDPAVSAGIHHYNELNSAGFQLGLGIPLPIFNHNQAGVMRAKHRLSQSQAEKYAAEINLNADLYEAYQSLTGALSAVNNLQSDVLPNVQKAWEAATEGYRQGKFGYLEVLDAQRTLFEAKGRYIEALKAYHQAVTNIERLIGGALFNNNSRHVGQSPTLQPKN